MGDHWFEIYLSLLSLLITIIGFMIARTFNRVEKILDRHDSAINIHETRITVIEHDHKRNPTLN